ncbi:hypothetical protein [Caulobacter sp. FWC26]|uniref:hypothetical protein n=1 Tax=Caulobacter sp. FWC26 TaxID=69665 RepID=UPI000C1585DA|nr:hypothetical protein [Caulobacter sp. FWC26]AZS19211.1 hypothetical protein CSW63_00300 [Caulobacter sp. FWC26]
MPSAAVPHRKPESDAARTRRLLAQAVALADREHRARERLAGISGSASRDRTNVKPLAKIEDDDQRLAVWRARVERLEAQLDQTERKRETRAKIVLGTTLLAEAAADPDDPLLARLMAIVDSRVHRPRDRLAIAETLGLAIAPVKAREVPALPDFEALAADRLAREAPGAEAKPGVRRRKKGG